MSNIIWDGDTDTTYITDANWQGGADPAAADDVFFPSGNSNAVAGSDQSGTALTSLSIDSGYSGAVGSITAGKPTYLQIVGTTVNLAGSGVTYLDLGTTTTCNINGAGSSAGAGQYGLNLTGGTITTLNVNLDSGQTLGIATFPGETATITNLNISGGGTVVIGSGVTVTTVKVAGGTVETNCAITTLTVTGGKVTHEAGAITTLNLNSGTVNYNTTDTLATANVYGTLDFSGDNKAKTVTTLNLYKGGTVKDTFDVVTFTNEIAPAEGCTIQAA